jgi:prepilin-type processing-associated H-X9-DG protein
VTFYVGDSGYGRYVSNGVLYGGSYVRIADITDGTSNVMAMSEQGRPLLTEVDNRSCMWGGGAWNGCYLIGEAPSGSFCMNLTQIQYGINNMTGLPQADTPYKSSNPLSSRHTGGVHALKCDGSVIFLSENVNFLTLLRLAHKSDSQPVGEY